MFRRALIAGGVLLTVFHGWLFASQVWDGQLADIALLVRWIVAGGLMFGLVGLRRRRVSGIRSRQAIAIWLLAALLHGPAIGERVDQGAVPAVPEAVSVLSSAAVACVLALGLALLTGLIARARRDTRRDSTRVSLLARFVSLPLDLRPVLAARPPPIA
jgi:hypothetical protein